MTPRGKSVNVLPLALSPHIFHCPALNVIYLSMFIYVCLLYFPFSLLPSKELLFVSTMKFPLLSRSHFFPHAQERERRRGKKLVIIPINIIYVDSLLFLFCCFLSRYMRRRDNMSIRDMECKIIIFVIIVINA